jgi:hypothetical protein
MVLVKILGSSTAMSKTEFPIMGKRHQLAAQWSLIPGGYCE